MRELLTIPFANPVLVFALATAIFLSVPLFFERMRIPSVIGLILSGTLVGPHGLGWLQRDETIVLLGTVGLLYLMFLAALEIDLQGFRRHRNHSLVLGVIAYLIPQGLGLLLGTLLGFGISASVLLGALLASHTLLAFPIASRLGIAKNIGVTAAVGATIITDLLALIVLAVIAGSARGEMNAAFWVRMIGSMAAFTALVFLGLPRLARWFFRRQTAGEVGDYMFIVAALFASAVLAELAGMEPIIGAFFAGLALNPLVPEGTPLHNRLVFFGEALLVPFFLLSVGMLVDFRVFAGGTGALIVTAGMVACAVTGKYLAARIVQWRFGYTAAEGWTVFGLSVPQAAATLAVVLVGYDLKLFSEQVLNGAIVLILVTCMLGPWVVERFGRKVALAEARAPYQPGSAPQRIVIPVADPAGAEPVLDLAAMLRTPGSTEPLLPVMVVQNQGRETAARVAEAEKLLGAMVIHGAGAGVPVEPLRRVDRNAVSGIVRSIAEWRGTLVVAGWDGRRTRRTGVLNDTLDQLVARTQQLTVVARINAPLGTTSRVVLLVPPYLGRMGDVLAMAKQLTSRIKAELAVVVAGDDAERVRAEIESIRPQLPTTFEAVAKADDLVGFARGNLRRGDLVVLVSERRGRAAWQRDLDRLPRTMAEVAPENLLVVYPGAGESDVARGQSVLADALAAGRVSLALPSMPMGEALQRMIADEPRDGRAMASALEGTAPVEVAPGVVFLCARVDRIGEPRMFLGMSPEGIAVPDVAAPAHMLVAVATPPDESAADCRHLADIAPIVSDPERVGRLYRATTVDELASIFRRGDLQSAEVRQLPERVARAHGLAGAGERIQRALDEVVKGYAARLRGDAAIGAGEAVSAAELEDHASTFVADIAQALILLERGETEPDLLRDGTEIQRVISVLHGGQRFRLGWTEEALAREFAILAEEIERVVSNGALPEEAADSMRVVSALLARAEQISVQGFQKAGSEVAHG